METKEVEDRVSNLNVSDGQEVVAAAEVEAKNIFNFNVGILGHVDSGKTTLAQALSTTASTAAFDKNPQSAERGITLDLGFSSFRTASPDHIRTLYPVVQYTLVDCPGHASLIKTIIGGAQIIDLMLLVVDITKGIQTQTAECLVIGEITCSKMVVVLNKVDAVPPEQRQKTVEKMTKRLKSTLENTKFKGCPVVAISAASRVSGKASCDLDDTSGIPQLLETLKSVTYLPERSAQGPFVFSVDHCFGIKGQGTVLTGTVLQGSISVNESIEVCGLKEVRRVKSMQMYRKPVKSAKQGDRIGLCVAQLDSSLLERGLVTSPPGALPPPVHAVIVTLCKIAHFKADVATKSKYHVSAGHETALATLTLIGRQEGNLGEGSPSVDQGHFNFDAEYKVVPCISAAPEEEAKKSGFEKASFGLLEFERPVIIVPNCKVLGSKLDTDIHRNVCRLAFEGHVVHHFADPNYRTSDLTRLKLFKVKCKEGVVERAVNDYELIGTGMFKKETNIHLFSGLKVSLSTGESGSIDGPFGQSGKFKVRLSDALSDDAKAILEGKKKSKRAGKQGTDLQQPDLPSTNKDQQRVMLALKFKRYSFDKRMVQ